MSRIWNFLKDFAEDTDHLRRSQAKFIKIPSFRDNKEGSLEEELEKIREARVRFSRIYRAIGVLLGLVLMMMLIYVVTHMPVFGVEDVPSNNEVYKKYVQDSIADTGAVNTVSGMILDYRAFDTLGESAVLFTAAAAVIVLLSGSKEPQKKFFGESRREIRSTIGGVSNYPGTLESKDVILRTVASLLIPLILLFGIAIVLNGHLSPGGGFSGGAVMGAGLILFANVFGADRVALFFNKKIYTLITSGSLLSYAALKCYSFYTGANHLPVHIPKGTPGNIISAGFILPLNIFVGMIVCSTMLAFYLLFTKGEI